MVRRTTSDLLRDELDVKRQEKITQRFTRSTWVYVIHWQERGPTKVGVACSPQARLSELQVGNPYPLKIYTAFGFVRRDQAFEIEAATLKRLRGVALCGEWLDATPLQVKDAVQSLVTAAGLYPLMWGDKPRRKSPEEVQRAKRAMAEYTSLMKL